MTSKRVTWDQTNGNTYINVRLDSQTCKALNALLDVTEEDRVELINKAIQAYAVARHAQANGGRVEVIERRNGERRVVRIA